MAKQVWPCHPPAPRCASPGESPGAKWSAPGTPHGVTLLELLVVMGIMLLLLAVAIPAMQFLPESRRTREAARAVNVFFGAARNKAITTGRPVGVILERLDRQPQACAVLRQAEVPPAYAGDVQDAFVRAIDYTHADPATDAAWPNYPYYESGGPPVLKVMVRDGDFSPGLIRRGALMQLNHQGPWYTITVDNNAQRPPSFPSPVRPDFPLDTSTNTFINFYDPPGKSVSPDVAGNIWITSHLLTLTLDPRFGTRSPYPEARGAGGADMWAGTLAMSPDPLPRVPFKIYRQPVASSGRVLELSRGAVIDLGASGTDGIPDAFAPVGVQDPSSVVVLFGANGAVDRLIVQGVQVPVAAPIYLLIGRWDHVPTVPVQRGAQPLPVTNPDAEDGLHNWEDQGNLWLAINPQTGLVTVATLNADLPPNDPKNPTTNMYIPSGADKAEQLYNGRRMVREAQISEGGR